MRLVLAALTLSLAAPAWADGPIATADPGAGAPVPSAEPAPPLRNAYDDGPDRSVIHRGPCGPTRVGPDGKPDQRIRGQVDVGVGTGGYHHVGVAACKPLPNGGAVAVDVSQTDWGHGRR